MTKKLFVMLFDFGDGDTMYQVNRFSIDELDNGILLKYKGKLYVHADSKPMPDDRWTLIYVEQRGVIELPDEEMA